MRYSFKRFFLAFMALLSAELWAENANNGSKTAADWLGANSSKEAAAVPKDEISRDDWLNSMAPMLPKLVCQEFMNDKELSARFKEVHLSYEQCLSLIPESEKVCADKVRPKLPERINLNQLPEQLGQEFGECIGEDFAKKHLIQ